MSFNIETKCVQSGYTPKNGEPRVVPIVQSTTYKYESSEQMGRLFDLQESGYFYTRLQNPTNDCVAAKIADLEGGVGAMLTSSGQAASFFSVFNICSAGDHVVAASAIYGGTFNLFNVTMKSSASISLSFAPMRRRRSSTRHSKITPRQCSPRLSRTPRSLCSILRSMRERLIPTACR